jgi:hypothetical protein
VEHKACEQSDVSPAAARGMRLRQTAVTAVRIPAAGRRLDSKGAPDDVCVQTFAVRGPGWLVHTQVPQPLFTSPQLRPYMPFMTSARDAHRWRWTRFRRAWPTRGLTVDAYVDVVENSVVLVVGLEEGESADADGCGIRDDPCRAEQPPDDGAVDS